MAPLLSKALLQHCQIPPRSHLVSLSVPAALSAPGCPLNVRRGKRLGIRVNQSWTESLPGYHQLVASMEALELSTPQFPREQNGATNSATLSIVRTAQANMWKVSGMGPGDHKHLLKKWQR